MYRIGQRFLDLEGDEYILAQTDAYECALICLREGNRYARPKPVDSPSHITEMEFDTIAVYDEFSLIK